MITPSSAPQRLALGIDVGGSGIKGAPVDLDSGEFAAPRLRIPTPVPSTPDAVATVIADLVAHFNLPLTVPVGVAFPAPMSHGQVKFIANLDQSWSGVNLPSLLARHTGRLVTAANDADAAGVGEARYGAARDISGLVLVVTLGTGIGSALLIDGVLVPNTEFGHLEIDGVDAELRASDAARDREGLSWEEWAYRLQRYFTVMDKLLSPDAIVVGGGVSKHHEKFLPLLNLPLTIIPAQLRNAAGIVGAAALAGESSSGSSLV